jgi:hypothetical protein
LTVTPDDRYFFAHGRLWSMANPGLDDVLATLFTCFGQSLLAT